MILGLTTSAYTLVHVFLSLAGIGSGFVVLAGLIAGQRREGWARDPRPIPASVPA